jgi:HEPN domain-containing protein
MNPSEAKRWIDYAETDLRAAQTLFETEDSFPRQICFLAQQCAEKAIESILVLEEVNFPRNHDLDRLRDLLPKGWKVKEEFPDLAALTIWSVESRYPGNMPDITENEARETLQMAKSVFDVVSTELQERILRSIE